MILVVGLGNPGKQFEGTRHNVGFEVLESLANEFKTSFKMSEKFNAEIAEATVTFPGEKKHVKVLLAKPQTFMNNSGESVAKLVNFYKFRTQDQVWVVNDDLDIDLGTLRIRVKGGSAGQKGVQDIIDRLGTDEFARFRVGIRPEGGQPKPAEEFVLEKFRPEEKQVVKEEIRQATEMIIHAMDRGIIETSI